MNKHTPGPWTVIIDDTGGPFTGWPSVQAPEHIDTAVVHRAGFKQEYWGDLSQRECIANAHLIAAAPDMSVALLNLLERYTGLVNCGDCGFWDPEAEDEVIAARAVMARATQS